MTVEHWYEQEFEYTHERRAFNEIITDLKTQFDSSGDYYFVLSNFTIQGQKIDVAILKPDAMIILELKECDAPLKATENGPWVTIPHGRAIGTGAKNPYQQVGDYRHNLMDFLKAHIDEFLPPGKARDIRDKIGHVVKGLVVVSPRLHPQTENKISHGRSPWFCLTGLDQVLQEIRQQTTRGTNFSEVELRYR